MEPTEREMEASRASSSFQEYELESLSIGAWRSWQHEKLRMHVDERSERFLYTVCLHETPNKIKKKGVLWKKMFGSDPASPFRHRNERVTYRVISFEVPWERITGMDYTNPLCFDGRLVFECSCLFKKEFRNLEQFHLHYGSLQELKFDDRGQIERDDQDGAAVNRDGFFDSKECLPIQFPLEESHAPAAHEHVYYSKTIAVTFDSPYLPGGLKGVVQRDARLLRLCESGIPAWAIFLPLYGLYYRPWMRTSAKILFMLVSTVSMVLGFYDLYKNIPGLRNALGMYIKPLTDWLELHASLRLSMLLTYLAAKSYLFQWFVLRLSTVTRALQPMVAYVFTPFQSVGRVFWSIASQGTGLLLFVGKHLVYILTTLVRPFAALLSGSLMLVFAMMNSVIGPLVRIGKAFFSIPTFWLSDLWAIFCRLLFISRTNLREVIMYIAKVTKSAIAVAHAFKRPVVATSAVVPSSARWNLLKEPSVKVMKAFKSIVNFLVHIAVVLNKHRLTLEMAISHKWASFNERKSLAVSSTSTALSTIAETAGRAMHSFSPPAKEDTLNKQNAGDLSAVNHEDKKGQ